MPNNEVEIEPACGNTDSLKTVFLRQCESLNTSDDKLNLIATYSELSQYIKSNPFILKNERGETALLILVKKECAYIKDLVELIPSSAWLEKNVEGKTPLHFIAELGYDSLSFIFQKYDHDNVYDDKGFLPIHLAIKNNHFALIQKIVNEENIDTLTQDNNTLLHIAARYGYFEIVDYLLSLKPTLYTNNDGYTSYDIAQQSAHFKVSYAIIIYQNILTSEYYNSLINRENIDFHEKQENSLISYSAWRYARGLEQPIGKNISIKRKFSLYEELGFRVAYAHPPNGLDLLVGDAYLPQRYKSYTIYNINGINCYALFPHSLDGQEIFILFTGTDSCEALQRDLKEETPGIESIENEIQLIGNTLNSLLKIQYQRTSSKPLKLSIIGHSLAASDSWALYSYFLKNLIKQHPDIKNKDSIIDLINNTPSFSSNDSFDLKRYFRNNNYLKEKLPRIDQLTVSTQNSVFITKKQNYKYQNTIEIFKSLYPKTNLFYYSSLTESDFVNITGECYPLMNIEKKFMRSYFRITDHNPYAFEKGIGYLALALTLNPRLSPVTRHTVIANTVISSITAVIFGPYAGIISAAMLLSAMLSEELLNKGCKTIKSPHQYYPEEVERKEERESNTKYLSNTKYDECTELNKIFNSGNEIKRSIFNFLKPVLSESVTPKKNKPSIC